jgi:acetyl-CoA acyltransferase
MNPAYIVDIVRSPFGRGREGGALSTVHPVDLLAQVLQALMERTGIDSAEVEDVIAGCVSQIGEQAGNIARHAWLAAGLAESTPGVTLDRKCGSAQQSLDFAAQAVMSGSCDVVVAGGVEMMSRVPAKWNRQGRDELGPMFRARFPEGLVAQGISAELIAARYALSREATDAFALRSHERAALAADRGWLTSQIIPIRVPMPDGHMALCQADEGIRRDTSAARLASLPPAFANDGLKSRFPEINWCVTAGSSSQITDGASAILVCSEAAVKRLQLKPRARIVQSCVAGDDPIVMLTAIIPATRKLLHKSGLSIKDIDAFEVNEAFASVVLAWQKTLNVDLEKVNDWGGAIAFGHPVGASGGRLMASLLGRLEHDGGRYGLQTMCESGGMANATLIERL